MPTKTAPIAHAGMPKKNRAYGYSATKMRNTASSTGRMPAWGRSSSVPTMPGTTVRTSRRTAKRTRPSSPSISRPKYQKMASVMTVHRSGIVGQRPGDDPPQLAAPDQSSGHRTSLCQIARSIA